MSIDMETYGKLKKLQLEYGFKNLCELMTAFTSVLLDRLKPEDSRRHDLPEDDGKYIDQMFDELGNSQRVPDGSVPVRHKVKGLE